MQPLQERRGEIAIGLVDADEHFAVGIELRRERLQAGGNGIEPRRAQGRQWLEDGERSARFLR